MTKAKPTQRPELNGRRDSPSRWRNRRLRACASDAWGRLDSNQRPTDYEIAAA